MDSDSFFPNYNMGVLKAEMKIYDAATTYFEKALSIAKQEKELQYEANVHSNMAIVYEQQGMLEKAISSWQSVARARPGDVRAKDNIDRL
jgi:tetratricopeptide (TPR) repeat protein